MNDAKCCGSSLVFDGPLNLILQEPDTGYLVRPVAPAEDELEASDFEPEENGEEEDSDEDEEDDDEDDDDEEDGGKVEAPPKRKRSGKDEDDSGDDDGDDDVRPSKRQGWLSNLRCSSLWKNADGKLDPSACKSIPFSLSSLSSLYYDHHGASLVFSIIMLQTSKNRKKVHAHTRMAP